MSLLVLLTILTTAPELARSQTLAQALNATNLTWTTSGASWSPETSVTHDGVAAAQSGYVFSSMTATLQTTVTGPGTLTFWWQNPSYDNSLSFSVAGATLASIYVHSTWQQQTYYLGSGSQTLKWVYAVITSPGDSYHGYVDEVNWTSGATAPVISAQPIDQSQVVGLNATFTVTAGGSPTLGYHWQLNGTNIPGATASTYTVTNVQPSSIGIYNVVVTNVVGSIVSSNAVLEFGQITGWGAPTYGDTSIPTGATNIVALAGGLYLSLALKGDGTLAAWGLNNYSQTNLPPDLTNAVAIAAGDWDGLALRPEGTVTHWGDNLFGQANVPVELTNAVAIASGHSHCVALRADGTVATWGDSRFGITNVPAGLTNAVAIDAGSGYSLALKADGTVAAWGSLPAAVPTNLARVVAISAGLWHSLALLADGTVNAWGVNNYGQISVPAGLTNVVAIAAGDLHSLALLANGTVVGWGDNSDGQTNIPAGLTNVHAIAAGSYHNLALVGSGPPKISAMAALPMLSAAGFSLSLPSQSGRVYALQYMDSLTDQSWAGLPLVAGTGGTLVLTDPAPGSTGRFYRVLRW